MTQETREFDEYFLEKALHSIGALSDDQEEMILKALLIMQKDRGEVGRDDADKLLRDFERQRLISTYNRRDILKKLYADE